MQRQHLRHAATLLVAVALASTGGRAAAQPTRAPRLAPLDPSAIPARCDALARRAVATSMPEALSARLSLASCLSDARLAGLVLCDCNQSVLQLNDATGPSFALLDEVALVGEPSLQVIAEHAKAELWQAISIRMIDTVPAAVDATPAALELRDARMQLVDGMIAPWRDRALDAHQRVLAIAKAHPELATNPVVTSAVRDSRARVGAAMPVATR